MRTAAIRLHPFYSGKGVMLMDPGFVVSLLGLLVAIAGLVLDAVTFAIASRKEKRLGKEPPPDS
jgi:UPF0716 family protein affecting phage T7 exclusion